MSEQQRNLHSQYFNFEPLHRIAAQAGLARGPYDEEEIVGVGSEPRKETLYVTPEGFEEQSSAEMLFLEVGAQVLFVGLLGGCYYLPRALLVRSGLLAPPPGFYARRLAKLPLSRQFTIGIRHGAGVAGGLLLVFYPLKSIIQKWLERRLERKDLQIELDAQLAAGTITGTFIGGLFFTKHLPIWREAKPFKSERMLALEHWFVRTHADLNRSQSLRRHISFAQLLGLYPQAAAQGGSQAAQPIRSIGRLFDGLFARLFSPVGHLYWYRMPAFLGLSRIFSPRLILPIRTVGLGGLSGYALSELLFSARNRHRPGFQRLLNQLHLSHYLFLS